MNQTYDQQNEMIKVRTNHHNKTFKMLGTTFIFPHVFNNQSPTLSLRKNQDKVYFCVYNKI